MEGERGMGSYCFIGTEFVFGMMKILELDNGDSYTILRM